MVEILQKKNLRRWRNNEITHRQQSEQSSELRAQRQLVQDDRWWEILEESRDSDEVVEKESRRREVEKKDRERDTPKGQTKPNKA